MQINILFVLLFSYFKFAMTVLFPPMDDFYPICAIRNHNNTWTEFQRMYFGFKDIHSGMETSMYTKQQKKSWKTECSEMAEKVGKI